MDGCILDSKTDTERVVKCLEAAILRRVSETSPQLDLAWTFSTFFLASFSIAYQQRPWISSTEEMQPT
ncbi:protein CHROMATIN REMODELING 5-like isoform X5 [Iris pallida]|uniref:Protein CHROMATIN REMODELING 5-like isoform X5 n=1 Tax=Iris pallida TaxID=29817 RepID=A0AAX6EI52_IRIPA|nr:protein CHROMATIN REMODELING 5-like isoform X5 [Iris pallida]